MSTSTWDLDSSTATTYYCEIDTMRSDQLKRNSWKFHSKAVEEISKISELKGAVAVFAYRESPIFMDRGGLDNKGMRTYYNDPVVVGYDSPTRLESYNFAIVMDALEYMPEKMARANLIKEALATLKLKSNNNPYLLILSKTPKMVEELAKSNGYEEAGDGFLVPRKKNDKFNSLTIQGLDIDDLIDIAYFAGAKYIEEDILIETDLACIRIYLNKQG